MSAIAGIINIDGSPVDRSVIKQMANASIHRGPDGVGEWISGPAGMVHLRLATTRQEEHETQPFLSRDGRYVVVFDGRLDNRFELINSLSDSGLFTTDTTDVEMVLAAYLLWGRRCASRLVGDFAFVIWDSKTRRVFVARDPIGVRMFNYFYDGSVFVFGTEIKQLLVHPAVPRSLNEESMALYLCGISRWEGRTFYEGIERLPGGNTLELTNGQLSISEFWNPDPWDQIIYKDIGQYREHYNDLLVQAVGSRLRSSGPIGIMLSGGLDSSTITSVASKLVKNSGDPSALNLHAYHWTYSGSPANDKPAVEAVAQAAGIDIEYISADDVWAMKPVTRSARPDEPFIFHFESMHYKAMALFRQAGQRVLLTGEGGDEAWSPGYMLYLRDWFFRGKFLSIWKDWRQGSQAYRVTARKHLKEFLFGSVMQKFRRPTSGVPQWLDSGLKQRLEKSGVLDRQDARTFRDSNYTQHRGYPPFFVGNDRVTSDNGIEARHPLWDSRLVEFLTRVPPTVRFQGGWGKLFMKQAMRGTVPPFVLNREPVGSFSGLMMKGLRDQETSRLREQMANSQLERLGVAQGDVLRSVFESYIDGDDSKWPRLFWSLASEEWLAGSPGMFEPASVGTPVRQSSVAVPG